MTTRNDILEKHAQCQIIVFPWTYEVPDYNLSYDQLSQSEPIDVSLELQNAVSFDKDLGGAAGSFSFSLSNTRDWKRIIRPGQWCLIYMTNDGDLNLPKNVRQGDIPSPDLQQLKNQKNRLRGICYIDRISPKADINSDGGFDVTYDVYGRDFGIVYEETTIWHNFFNFESGIVDAAVNFLNARPTRTVDQLVQTIHKLFYSPTDFPSLTSRDPKDKKLKTLTQVGFQWLMPKELLSAIDAKLREGKRETFYGHLDGLFNFSPSKASYPIENPMSTLNGNAWEKLKAYSVQPFHELFSETTDNGQPQLTFRPIPWKLDGTYYPLIAPFITAYKDLADSGVQITTPEILSFDLGEDNHSRYNHFLTQVQTSDYTAFDNITELKQPSPSGRQYPYAQSSSIARHGFKPMHNDINALIQLGLNVDGKADQGILVQYNEVMFDYWSNAIFFESGTAKIIGRNDVKLGKALLFEDDAPYNAGKIFYIEGYTDEFVIEDNGVGEWNQNLKLSRGAELEAVRKFRNPESDDNVDFSTRQNEFKEDGEFTEKN